MLMQSQQCSATTHPLPLQTSIFGTVDWCLCSLWAQQNLLSFSKVPVFKNLETFSPMNTVSQPKSWEPSEDWLLMPVQGQKVSGLMLANLPLSLIELISGVMGWGQSPSSFAQHWQHNRLMKLIRSELQWWWEISKHWILLKQGKQLW